MACEEDEKTSEGMEEPGPGEAEKELARLIQAHSEKVLQSLVDIVTGGDSPQARVAAANAILDRGYGKPKSLSGSGSSKPLVIEIVKFSEDQTTSE